MGHKVHLVYFVYYVLHRDWHLNMSVRNFDKPYLDIPRVFRTVMIDVSPPAQTTVESEARNEGASLTIHNHFHIVHKTVDNLQDVRLHHAGFVLRETVQSTQNFLDLAVSQQLLCELPCNEFRNRKR